MKCIWFPAETISDFSQSKQYKYRGLKKTETTIFLEICIKTSEYRKCNI